MLKALEKEDEKPPPARHHERSMPRPAADYFASHAHPEKKSSSAGLIVIGAGAAVLLLIGLVVALSENGGTATAGNGRNYGSSNTGAAPPSETGKRTAYESGAGESRPAFSFEEIEALKKAYGEIDAEVDSRPGDFEENISRLERFEKSRDLPDDLKWKIKGRITAIQTAWEKQANVEFEKHLTRIKELEKKWKLDDAIKHLETFPERFSKAASVVSRIEKEKERLKNTIKAKKEYETAIAEAKALVESGKYAVIIPMLEKLPKMSPVPPELAQQIAQLRKKALDEIKRREDEEKKRQDELDRIANEAELEMKRKRREARESEPLHFANWTAELPSLTTQVRLEGAQHKKHAGEHSLVFPAKKKGVLELQFELDAKPEYAFLRVYQTGTESSRDTLNARVLLQVNGNIAAPAEDAEEFGIANELDSSDLLKKGKNILRVEVSPGEKRLLLAKLELRVYLPEKEFKKEKARARAVMRRLLAQAKKEQRRKRKEESERKKKPAVWPPPIRIGETVSIYNGKDLSGWKTVGRGQCTVKDGTIVCINTSGQPVRLMTSFPGQATWRDYEVEFEVVPVRGSLYIGVHGTGDNTGAFTGSELGPDLQLNKLFSVKVRAEGNKLFIKVGDSAESMANGNIRYPAGAPYISIEPNSEIRIKAVRFTLRSK